MAVHKDFQVDLSSHGVFFSFPMAVEATTKSNLREIPWFLTTLYCIDAFLKLLLLTWGMSALKNHF